MKYTLGKVMERLKLLIGIYNFSIIDNYDPLYNRNKVTRYMAT